MKRSTGFTLVEMAVAIAVVAILSAFSYTSFLQTEETRDAALVQSVQASLQAVLLQASNRLDLTPQAIVQQFPNNVINATSASLGGGAQGAAQLNAAQGGVLRLTIRNSTRQADFQVENDGDVVIVPNSLTNFVSHQINANGLLERI
jgi:prepilin-type N-terminal cleavage/methylation domain-containing protein